MASDKVTLTLTGDAWVMARLLTTYGDLIDAGSDDVWAEPLTRPVLTQLLDRLSTNAYAAVRLFAENPTGIKTEKVQAALGFKSYNELAGALASVGARARQLDVDPHALYKSWYGTYSMDPAVAEHVLEVMADLGK